MTFNRKLISTLWTLLFLACLAVPVQAAESIPSNKDLSSLQAKAAEGDARAQHDLGMIYYEGQGLTQNYAEAVKWFRKAADQGNAQSQDKLGISYAKGRGVTQDYVEAVKWFRKAADQGDARSQNNLGISYADGRGVPQDFQQAAEWYRKAADQGFADAAGNLGSLYSMGLGVPRDYAEAANWVRKGAERGNSLAQLKLGAFYREGTGVSQDNTEAAKWFRIAATQADAKAIGLFHQAADQGSDNAQYALGLHYREVVRDEAEAGKWFSMAAARGNAFAQAALAESPRAKEGFRTPIGKADEQGNADAKAALAELSGAKAAAESDAEKSSKPRDKSGTDDPRKDSDSTGERSAEQGTSHKWAFTLIWIFVAVLAIVGAVARARKPRHTQSSIVPPPLSQPKPENAWYYEAKGKKHGPFEVEAIKELIAGGKILRSQKVWKHGFQDWKTLDETELGPLFSGAPPLTKASVNNGTVWVIALCPLLNLVNPDLWWLSVIALPLAFVDEMTLRKAGHDTSGFGYWWALLIPAYLYRRANVLKQPKTYFIANLCAIGLVVAAAMFAGPNISEMETHIKARLAERYFPVRKVTLVHKSGNEYTGVAELVIGEPLDLEVTVDGDQYIWKAK